MAVPNTNSLPRFEPRKRFLLLLFLIATLLAGTANAQPQAHKSQRLRHRPAALEYQMPQMAAWRYFHPAWTESRSLFVGTTQEARPGDKIDQYLRLLASDPKHRLDPELRAPNFLLDRVLFWVSIYARYPSHVHVVHDRDTPNVIYGYIDFAPLKQQHLSPVQRELKARAIERGVLGMLRQLLAESLGISNSRMLADEERRRLREIMLPLGPELTNDAARILASVRTQTGQSDIFQVALRRCMSLLPEAEKAFRQSNLPVGLARIPFVESSFNARAQSRAGAFGVWQFTPIAARDVLPRRDRKSWHDTKVQAVAATRLLRRYRQNLPDWGTAVTAYNAGIGTLARLVRTSRATSMKEVLASPASQRALGFAGRNFFSEVLAVNVIEAYKTQVFVPWLRETDREPTNYTPRPPAPPATAPAQSRFAPMLASLISYVPTCLRGVMDPCRR